LLYSFIFPKLNVLYLTSKSTHHIDYQTHIVFLGSLQLVDETIPIVGKFVLKKLLYFTYVAKNSFLSKTERRVFQCSSSL